MMEITAVFESWHIGDGNYPPFSTGMVVKLAFMIEAERISSAENRTPTFKHLGDAEYDFCGEVLKIYHPEGEKKSYSSLRSIFTPKRRQPSLAIIDTGGFRFYIESVKLTKINTGQWLCGQGTLLLDYYVWTEFLPRRTNPPDIFYALEVTRIRKVMIPARFIQSDGGAKAYPTRVSPADIEEITELETMDGQPFDTEFYLVDFKESVQKDIPLTFRG